MEPDVRFTVLGPVRAWRDGVEIQLGPPQVRSLLAVLLVQAGRPVGLDAIVDLLWGQEPPSTAVNALHGHVGTLRRLLEPGLAPRRQGRWLVRSAGGYQFSGDEHSLDLLRFRGLAQTARDDLVGGDDVGAVRRFAEALDLVQGRCAANLPASVRADPVFVGVDRACADVAREAADCALRAGRSEAVVTAVRMAADRDPLDESLQARLMLLLAATGRQAEALSVYERARALLADELGIDPGAELRAAHTTLVRAAATAPTSTTDVRRIPPTNAIVRPAQLPTDLATFTGRRDALRRVLDLTPSGARAQIVSAISGMAGVGKTTTAVHWAHRVADRYPDGQLYVNLRGFDPGGSVMRPDEALRHFLDAFGVAPERVPRTVDGQAALYRSLLAERRVLILLDNARDAEQVRPLLPGSPGCLVIVTSRDDLAGLVATHDAHPMSLDVLSEADSYELLVQRLGRHQVDAEPDATAEIIRRSGCLPLALAVLAARAALRPSLSLGDVLRDLTADDDALDTFAHTDIAVDVRTVFSWSYHALTVAGARLFRLLGHARTGDVTVPAAASLAAVSERQVRSLLAELVRTSLVNQTGPGRYAMHDLLTAYASELAADTDTDDDRRAALRRLFDHYLHTAMANSRQVNPRPGIDVEPPVPGAIVGGERDREHALAWFTRERPALLAAVTRSAATLFPGHTWRLAWAMGPHLHWRGHWADWVMTQEAALAALEDTDETLGKAHVNSQLGLAYTEFGRYDDARARLQEAIGHFASLHHHTGLAEAYRRLAGISYKEERYDQALAALSTAFEQCVAGADRLSQGHVLNSIAWVQILRGEHQQALESAEQALPLIVEYGNLQGEAATRDTLGHALHHLGRYQEAADSYRAAIRVRQITGDRVYEANTLHRLGDNHAVAGEPDLAATTWREALAIMTDIGHPDTDAVAAKLTDIGR
ncbi:BTAD domain-containing putative transcriptional regulator [Asanoa sp. WMMD1127]|uniref:AfsR/SARP family transcriptional regulator n=1 Tax=Asanoa sp. WMMD1127 TaxID=3016107 RepID=UPI002417F337|nr:BTAD domain-containing putative transcriptional regulator [Asanoa sp. WMMD1127]MDG4821814.1 BTAD domain-containing putative transcriptional regulator [Asanoa sp. WMMD1127]